MDPAALGAATPPSTLKQLVRQVGQLVAQWDEEVGGGEGVVGSRGWRGGGNGSEEGVMGSREWFDGRNGSRGHCGDVNFPTLTITGLYFRMKIPSNMWHGVLGYKGLPN